MFHKILDKAVILTCITYCLSGSYIYVPYIIKQSTFRTFSKSFGQSCYTDLYYILFVRVIDCDFWFSYGILLQIVKAYYTIYMYHTNCIQSLKDLKVELRNLAIFYSELHVFYYIYLLR